ncbi:MAG TPA: hypothetical protein VD994_09840 [Prosthecobacter sp.]|nr:hypothetical protein [Prosthecobacter sp.]
MIPETVETEIVIESVHGHRTWHATLPNGKKVMAFVEEESDPLTLEPGMRVRAQLSVADFSRALVLVTHPPPA